MTVALPVLSAWGLETCVLPTQLLSTHTGGFGKPQVVSFGDSLEQFWRHWQSCDITFDAILTGYLGNAAAVAAATDIMERMLAPGGISIVDPAMADGGKVYSGLDENYIRAMGALCRRADIILPNATEAAMLAGDGCRLPEREELPAILERLHHPCAIVTGVDAGANMEIMTRRKGHLSVFRHTRLPGHYSGTGDLFAACFTGALLSGRDTDSCVEIASELTRKCIEQTLREPVHWYGIRFESILPDICRFAERDH